MGKEEKATKSRSKSATVPRSKSPSTSRKRGRVRSRSSTPRKHKKRRHSSSESGSSSSSDSSAERKKRRKEKKEKKRAKKEKKRVRKAAKLAEAAAAAVAAKVPTKPEVRVKEGPDRLMADRAKAMAPMTKEEWDKRQSVIRKVLDPETGRQRLIKGDGEVIEECVSRERHKEINRKATRGDGDYFQSFVTDRHSKRH